MVFAACVLALLMLISHTPLRAQSSHLFGSVGRISIGDDGDQLTLSGGGEHVSASGASVGGDVLVSFGRTGFRPGAPNGERYRQYLLSALVGMHAPALGGRFTPFAHGGLSVITDPDCCGPYFGWNVGGGANYWLTRRVGLRADARFVFPFVGEGFIPFGRVGITFR